MNTKSFGSANWKRHSLVILAIGLLGLGAVSARAEHYDLHCQLLVTGTQVPDPAENDGLHFIRQRCVGTSWQLGLFNESSTCNISIVAAASGTGAVMLSGQGVLNSTRGQIFYRFQGTVAMSGNAGIRNLLAQTIRSTIAVTGGTGEFAGAWGRGTMTSLVDSDNRFSSQADLTISIPGEK